MTAELLLTTALVLSTPGLSADEAREHAQAALAAATPGVPAELLLAVAHVESRYLPDYVSRKVRGQRHTGRWRLARAPHGWHGSLYCGFLQTRARSWAQCQALREPTLAYQRAVERGGEYSIMG